MEDQRQTLKTRGNVYGDFVCGTGVEVSMLHAITNNYRNNHNGKDMPMRSQVWLSKIVMKLSRLSVTPDHIDSWHDIAGYAMLIEDALNQAEEDANAKS